MSQNKLIVALDVNTRENALSLVRQLHGFVTAFKVGLELFHSVGPSIIEDIQSTGERVFYDSKFHDIPNTIRGAVAAMTRMGVWMLNVHCAGGLDMMKEARKIADATSKTCHHHPPLVIGVTLLTSIKYKASKEGANEQDSSQSIILRYARLAKEAGLDGVVCSGPDVAMLRKEFGQNFILVVPGIRPGWAEHTPDQKRIITPQKAVNAGADYLVIGRPVITAKSPKVAIKKIIDEIS